MRCSNDQRGDIMKKPSARGLAPCPPWPLARRMRTHTRKCRLGERASCATQGLWAALCAKLTLRPTHRHTFSRTPQRRNTATPALGPECRHAGSAQHRNTGMSACRKAGMPERRYAAYKSCLSFTLRGRRLHFFPSANTRYRAQPSSARPLVLCSSTPGNKRAKRSLMSGGIQRPQSSFTGMPPEHSNTIASLNSCWRRFVCACTTCSPDTTSRTRAHCAKRMSLSFSSLMKPCLCDHISANKAN